MTGYAISSLLWAMAGLVVGFILGRAGQRAPFFGGEVTDKSGRSFDMFIGALVIVLALASVIVMTVTISRQQRAIDCQTDFNAQFVKALEERSASATTERGAQRRLLTSITSDVQDPVVAQMAIEEYLRGLADADKVRSANPLPVRPEC